jgi:uncharacterized membrane protein
MFSGSDKFQKQISATKKRLPLILLFLFGAVYIFMALANHYFFRTVTWDYGVYNFAFWDYSHLRISQSPLTSGTFLQDHFSLTLMYFIPVFWLLNWLTGTYTLIIIQSILILVAGWYSYKLILLKSKDYWLGALTIAYYFLILGRYTTLTCDCNLAVIASCFVPVFLYYFERKKFVIAFLLLVLSLLSRENMPLWFVFIFIVLMIMNRKDKRTVLFCFIGIIISVVYFEVLFKVLIPLIETPDRKYTLFNYLALGKNPTEAIAFIINHPIEAIKIFFTNHLNVPEYDSVKSEFFWVYLISGGFVMIYRPQYFIWFIPVVAQKVLNDNFIRWGISTYYAIEIVTLLPVAVFLTISELKNNYLRYSSAILVLMLTFYVTSHKLNPDNCVFPWTMHPDKENIFSKNFFKSDLNISKTYEILALVPENARVSSSNSFVSHLAQRKYIYIFPEVKDADYILLSVSDNSYLNDTPDQMGAKRAKYLNSPYWHIIASEYPVILLKKGSYSPLKQSSAGVTELINCNAEIISADSLFYMTSNNMKLEGGKFRSSRVSRSGKFSVELTPENPYGMSYRPAEVSAFDSIQIIVWRYPASSSGNLVVSCGEKLYQVSNTGKEIDSLGWEKLTLNLMVPGNIPTKDFVVYAWNSGKKPVYFDDMSIRKVSFSPLKKL